MTKEHHHHWHLDNHNKGVCEICGAEAQFPLGASGQVDILKPGKAVSNKGLHRFYETHKAEILADLDSLGRKKARDKWEIPHSSMSVLLKRWRPRVPSNTKAESASISLTSAMVSKSAGLTSAAEASQPIKMVKRIPHQCAICEDGEDSKYYLETPGGKLWLCDNCGEGIIRIFKELGIACAVEERE